jgi:hypothetical protein
LLPTSQLWNIDESSKKTRNADVPFHTVSGIVSIPHECLWHYGSAFAHSRVAVKEAKHGKSQGDNMARDPQYVQQFKKFARGEPAADDLPRLEAEIYGTNDRARAVMLGAVVELSLELFLKNKRRPSLNAGDTREMFEYTGPLGTFASKILIGYAFNWYGPETREDLTLIRTLRNEFAHSRKSFDFEKRNCC